MPTDADPRLEALYPFLHGRRKDLARESDALVDSVREKARQDHCLVVPTGSIHRVQETHVAVYHVLWDLVHTLLADDRSRLGEASP